MASKNRALPHILITEPEYFTEQSVSTMKKVGTVTAKRMTRKELLSAIKKVDVLVVRIETAVNKELLQHAAKLRCVVSATTGLNHIDVSLLKAKGIALFSLHGEHSVSTAEHTLALLFGVARNIPSAHKSISHGTWARWNFIGTQLTGKTLGIFGIGRVGTEVARRAKALHMNVIAYDPYVDTEKISDRGAQKVSFAALLKESDFISLHSHLTAETRGIFDAASFKKMKRTAILVNTARGEIIDENSLLVALAKGTIRAAGIDVYPVEPIPRESRLRLYAERHNNLVLTPHLGASTHDALATASKFAAESVKNFLK